ncbi:MAG: macro domain-containing protein [Nitrosopumilaceae archaeon]|nr:macro domain-containing protein [Nitrosopumilaceae archaeon]NIT99953.1 macro domain-containing protein [Nitrosopumilaceae archaeon]NIU86307.1 macro domain-containing protein [Nitrosopumilaceae archaeon]NIV65062.1 macro domain-containing protein [Nitrosopumilaceae archaeon]NIX60556.1 macro domain-containing protein [Nitrosopumilaceae archaeon]
MEKNEFKKIYRNKIIHLIKNDITERTVDVIVNAANSHLIHGGGVAAAIVRKGGRIIQDESNKIKFVPTGQVALTGSGKLPCKSIIHAVGPRMGEGDEDNKLKSTIFNVLKLATKNNFESISIPAISSGIFGFPKDRCAKIILECIKKYIVNNPNSSIKKFEICILDNRTFAYFKNEFMRI